MWQPPASPNFFNRCCQFAYIDAAMWLKCVLHSKKCNIYAKVCNEHDHCQFLVNNLKWNILPRSQWYTDSDRCMCTATSYVKVFLFQNCETKLLQMWRENLILPLDGQEWRNSFRCLSLPWVLQAFWFQFSVPGYLWASVFCLQYVAVVAMVWGFAECTADEPVRSVTVGSVVTRTEWCFIVDSAAMIVFFSGEVKKIT